MTPWKKIPSVTPGGKRFFYTRYSSARYPYRIRQCVCWDRFVRAWKAEHNQTLIGYYSTSTQAKKALEN